LQAFTLAVESEQVQPKELVEVKAGEMLPMTAVPPPERVATPQMMRGEDC